MRAQLIAVMLSLQAVTATTGMCGNVAAGPSAAASQSEPVGFTARLSLLGGSEAEIVFDGTIDDGWHVYSTDLGSGGPTTATFNVESMQGAETVGGLRAEGEELSVFDNLFGMTLRYFCRSVRFVQKIRFTEHDYSIVCYLEYGACSDEVCMPPGRVDFSASGKAPSVAKKAASDASPTTNGAEKKASSAVVATASAASENAGEGSEATVSTNEKEGEAESSVVDGSLWEPVIDELGDYDGGAPSSLPYVFLAGLAGGILALFTPCVWPIIPMTVSFFLKRNKHRRRAVREAVVYGASIVVIYVLLGLAVTLLFGASALNALSTNAFFNIFFFLLLVVFAASFFGAFDITLPSSWSNKVDAKSESTSGIISIFLMAFTLSLVSFSCTGPIIGFLLVAVSTQGSITAPAVGMTGFAVALAVPFTVFALFPSLIKSMPKSGSWMNVIKVVLGFVELAFALKFLSVADLTYGWHLLDRETFLSLWIALALLLGLYLLGIIRFKHDTGADGIGVWRFFGALVAFAFAIYMVPGLWGAPLKAISAFAPPMSTQDFNMHKSEVEARFTDYESAMAAARHERKPVMIDFTGYGCVNCRKMEAAVWTDARVASLLRDSYVLVSLYVDDKTPLEQVVEVEENGRKRLLRTVGDKWSYLQRRKFGSNTQPFYVVVDSDGHPLAGSRSYDEDIDAYVGFLEQGIKNFKTAR